MEIRFQGHALLISTAPFVVLKNTLHCGTHGHGRGGKQNGEKSEERKENGKNRTMSVLCYFVWIMSSTKLVFALFMNHANYDLQIIMRTHIDAVSFNHCVSDESSLKFIENENYSIQSIIFFLSC